VTVAVGGQPRPTDAVEFDGPLSCPSGRLAVGDAESGRVVEVPRGVVRVQVTRQPVQFADHVTVWIGSPQ
jgi:hypothetical protein